MSRDDSREDEIVGGNEFPELTGFESALAALAPRAAAIDREAFFFQAGRAAALSEVASRRPRPARWAWPLAFAGMTTAATALLVLLLAGPRTGPAPHLIEAPAVVEDRSIAPSTAENPAAHPAAPADQDFAAYANLREQVLARGLDASLPRPATASSTLASSGPKTYREMLQSVLQEM